MNNVYLEAKDLDLVAAALNFAELCLPVFDNHLKYQGHHATAQHAALRLGRLRQYINEKHHEALDREWQSPTN